VTSLASILRRPGRARAKGASAKGALAKALFVSYGGFDNNSAGHIAGFAAELARLGVTTAVCGRDSVRGAYAFGPPAFEFFTLAELGRDPKGVAGFDGAFDPGSSVMICWTPRKASRQAARKAARALALPYVVHFEDNEDHLSALRFEADPEAAAKDAAERAELLAGALGATIIEPRLAETLPEGLERQLLEPGVDHELFGAPMPPHRRASILKGLGAPADAAVMVYPGNIHRANAAEMAELYRAVGRLRADGRRIVLIKTGKDDVDMAGLLGADPGEAGVIDAGLLERPFLVDLVKCADLFVQPGAPGSFNDFRLPSKLPEFMAVGRPVVMPATNVGLRVKPGEEALLLHAGSAEEIAAAVGQILDDPALAARLAAGAQAYARRTWRWDRQGRLLLGFLERLVRA
jgi:glycosyltransferase involved in cell wall biosynthesis